MATYLEQKFVKKDTVEKRDYQISLAKQAFDQNCIIVLPTGLGKTTIAMQVIAYFLCNKAQYKGVLFLAPTRVLVNQHYESLKKNMTIEDISIITGEDPIAKRKKLWQNSIVCATPEITKNDLERNIIHSDQFGLVIFDEAHRTIGDYAYSVIADRFANTAHVLGMTATLPSEKEKATQILTKLRISIVAERNEDSPDVKPYIQQTDTEWVKVDLPRELKEIQILLKYALNDRYEELKRCGLNLGGRQYLSELLRVRQSVITQKRRAAKPLFTAIRLHYALNLLEAHGITPFLKFCERTQLKKGAGIKELFESDPNFTRAIHLARIAQSKNIEHSKIKKLMEIIGSIDGKILVFSSYRDSIDVIYQKLVESNIKTGILIGKAGVTGLKQKKQLEAVQKFRDGEYDVLIATRVGEEGLDISEVNHVIFYDNVPSSIRYVQRRGRTGRRDAGKLIVLIAKDTIDETYYWIGKRKINAARSMGQKMTKVLQKQSDKNTGVLDPFF